MILLCQCTEMCLLPLLLSTFRSSLVQYPGQRSLFKSISQLLNLMSVPCWSDMPEINTLQRIGQQTMYFWKQHQGLNRIVGFSYMHLKISNGNRQTNILADYCILLKALEKATRIISHQNITKFIIQNISLLRVLNVIISIINRTREQNSSTAKLVKK